MTITLRAGDAPIYTATTRAMLDAVTAASFGCRSEALSLLGFAAHVGSAGSLAHLVGVHDGALQSPSPMAPPRYPPTPPGSRATKCAWTTWTARSAQHVTTEVLAWGWVANSAS